MNLPNTKIKYIDYTEWFIKPEKFSLIAEHGNRWMFHSCCWKSPQWLFWRDIKQIITKEDKNTCLLFGTGKTYLQHINNKPCVIFAETDVSDYSGKYEQESAQRENFYWGNTLISTEIIKKQAYIMLELYQKMKLSVFYSNYNKLYDKTIYNLKVPLAIPTKKSKSTLFSIRDEYLRYQSDSDIYKYYVEGLKELSKEIDINFSKHVSKPYYLKEQ